MRNRIRNKQTKELQFSGWPHDKEAKGKSRVATGKSEKNEGKIQSENKKRKVDVGRRSDNERKIYTHIQSIYVRLYNK